MSKKELDNLDVWEEETLEIDNSHTEDQVDEATAKRYKEQLAWSKAEAERLRNLAIEREYAHASKDAASLLELHSTDSKLANEVAKKFGYADFKEAKKRIDENLWEKIVVKEWSKNDEKSFEEMYQKKKAEELHELSIKRAEKIIWKIKDEDLKEKAKTYFEKITKGKQLSIDDAEEFAEMATLYVNKDTIRDERFNEWLASLWSIGANTSKKGKSSDDEYVIVDGKLVLKSNKQQ
jgi:hypothetical protein